MTIDPPGHLRHGRTDTLRGSGWTPGALVGITECGADAASIADPCAITDVFTATADDHGKFAVPYRPIGATGTAQGPLDCTTAPGACVLAAANATDLEEFSTLPLTFDAPELIVRSTTVDEGSMDHHEHSHPMQAATSPPLDPESDMWTEARITATLSAAIGTATTVEWHTAAGTADETDFLARHGRVTVPAGRTTAVIVAKVMPDSIHEPTERFSVEVGGAPGTRIVDGSASVRIRDDDHHPMVSAHNGKGVEGRAAVRAFVMLSNPSHETVTVRWRTRGGTARAGDDYEGSRGVLTFHPGETKHRVRVPLIDDDRRERTEHFSVVLTGADGGELDADVATIALHDDD
jgi:hypothetical protein